MTILTTKIAEIGLMRWKHWLTIKNYKARIYALCAICKVSYFRPHCTNLSDFFAKIVISYMQIDFMMTRNVLGWTLGVKTLNNHQKLLGEKLFTLCNVKKYHNLGLSWPIWVIFVANMVISYVLIGFMMTRTSCSTIEVGRIGLEEY